nr:DNA-binding pseudobarrel domain-containing protein [Tanacetum cinerariifolium]
AYDQGAIRFRGPGVNINFNINDYHEGLKQRLPLDFVGLARINSKENIIVKSLDVNETQTTLRSSAATIVTTSD